MPRNSLFIIIMFIYGLAWCGAAGADEIVYDSGKRRDPFVKSGAQGSTISGLGGIGGPLQGIIYDPQKASFAIFGGKTFQQGEKVGDSVIVKIAKDHVVVQSNGEEKTLRIREEEKK